MDRERKNTPEEKGPSRIDAIYRALFNAILSQDLMPGTKLSEETIGSFFNVSRTMVRAALNRLHTEALVEFKQNRGAFVASPSLEEARQVFDARICIERDVAWRLAERITDQQIAQLERHVKQEHKVAHAGDKAEAIRLSGEFHLLAARMAGNDVLLGFLNSLITRTSLILAQHSRHTESDCSVDEHEAIVAALRDRDAAACAEAMTKHLRDVVARANLVEKKHAVRDLTSVLARYSAQPVPS